MVASFCREVGKAFDSLLILESQSRPVCVYPRLELVAVCKMNPVQERPLVEADRRCPLSRAHRLLELPYVNLNQFRIEPELSCCREYQIASQRLSDPVHRLIERVVCPRAGAFRPEVGLDPIARETLPTAPAEMRPSFDAASRPCPAPGSGLPGALNMVHDPTMLTTPMARDADQRNAGMFHAVDVSGCSL